MYAYGEKPDMIDLAVAHSGGIIRNQPFIDGNERTGFRVGVLFLGMHGFRFSATEEDTTQTIGLASTKRALRFGFAPALLLRATDPAG